MFPHRIYIFIIHIKSLALSLSLSANTNPNFSQVLYSETHVDVPNSHGSHTHTCVLIYCIYVLQIPLYGAYINICAIIPIILKYPYLYHTAKKKKKTTHATCERKKMRARIRSHLAHEQSIYTLYNGTQGYMRTLRENLLQKICLL